MSWISCPKGEVPTLHVELDPTVTGVALSEVAPQLGFMAKGQDSDGRLQWQAQNPRLAWCSRHRRIGRAVVVREMQERNSSTSKFCYRCGAVLDIETAVQIDQARGRIDQLLNKLTEDPRKPEKLLAPLES